MLSVSRQGGPPWQEGDDAQCRHMRRAPGGGARSRLSVRGVRTGPRAPQPWPPVQPRPHGPRRHTSPPLTSWDPSGRLAPCRRGKALSREAPDPLLPGWLHWLRGNPRVLRGGRGATNPPDHLPAVVGHSLQHESISKPTAQKRWDD